MKRPDEHVIDTLGQAQLRAVFEPLGWTVNKIENDYGADFEVEIFRAGESTGGVFKVQLKSSKSTGYSSAGDFISQELAIDSVKYLCSELRSPVLLIHADLGSGRTFWIGPQLDLAALKKLAEGTQKTTVTLRIPTANELPGSIDALLVSVAQAEEILASRVLISAPALEFAEAVRDRIDERKLI